MWWLAINHFNGRNPQGPNIRLVIVSSLLDYFGRHPKWCSDEGVPLRFDINELRSNSEIC